LKLRYTLRAAAELDDVLGLIAAQSPSGARNVQKRIQGFIDLLLLYPHAGQRVSKSGLRRVVVTPYPYLIFYRAKEDEIIIHGVRHGARKLLSKPL
jgi:plasmid stabilization system protein ParE